MASHEQHKYSNASWDLGTHSPRDFFANFSNANISELTNVNGTYPCSYELVVFVAYIITFVLGLFGNTLAIVAILYSGQHKKSVATCFILNLAIADELYVMSLPLMAHYSYTGTWVYGRVMCAVISPLITLNMFASIFTMVLMSVDRYIVVKDPLRSMRYRTPKLAVVLCVLVWLFSLAIVAPLAYFTTVDARRGCSTKLPNEHLWNVVELIVGFLVPILVMTVCYSQLVRHLTGASQLSQNQVPDNKRKVTVMVVSVTVIFLLCWAPGHILHIIPKQSLRKNVCVSLLAVIVSRLLEFLSSCCNPFIYWISSKNFRSISRDVLRKCCSGMACVAKSTKNPTSMSVTGRSEQTRLSPRPSPRHQRPPAATEEHVPLSVLSTPHEKQQQHLLAPAAAV